MALARQDGAPIAFAGIWEGRRDSGGETLRTFTILTTTANDDMAALNNRVPVIPGAADWAIWLGEGGGDHLALMRPATTSVPRL